MARIGRAIAPSNIAVIKYMGKKDPEKNLPLNPSLSLTLSELHSLAEVHWDPKDRERTVYWNPELLNRSLNDGMTVPSLSDLGVKRVLTHLLRVWGECNQLLPEYGFTVASTGSLTSACSNKFPTAAGVASSASAFSALTLAAVIALVEPRTHLLQLWKEDLHFRRVIARIARLGSGSACRSFLGPWCSWEEEEIRPIPSDLPAMGILLLITDKNAKAISSRQAHGLVTTSTHWQGRGSRAKLRWVSTLNALKNGDLKFIARTSWDEMVDMHNLFHTSEPPFRYITDQSEKILDFLRGHLDDELPPIVTMDAGPNIHVLIPLAEISKWKERIQTSFPDLTVITDKEGLGAMPLHSAELEMTHESV